MARLFDTCIHLEIIALFQAKLTHVLFHIVTFFWHTENTVSTLSKFQTHDTVLFTIVTTALDPWYLLIL